jgi:hypothetical protein
MIGRKVSHAEARQIAFRLIQGSFRRDGEVLDYDNRPRFSIPCRPDHDDDILIREYIDQQEAAARPRDAAPTEESDD